MTNGTPDQKVLDQEQTSSATNTITGTVSPGSCDVDTPTIFTEGGSFPLRITGIDGTEIGENSDAEYFRDGLYRIFGGEEAEVTTDSIDFFGRPLGGFSVDGIDWRHVSYEMGVSDNWGKYGFDKEGEDDDLYKWYGGKTQNANIEAYELLADNPEPSDIISDEDHQRLELLRKSLKSHVHDAAEGVLDKEDALAVARELFKDPQLLTLSQKRKWYEVARTSNIGEGMLAVWNDPFSRSNLERQHRTHTMDVSPRTDTSYLGMVKNAYDQQFHRNVGGKKVDFGSAMRGFRGETTEADLDLYIQQNNIPPDIAAKMYDEFEVNGFASATETANLETINRETTDQELAVDKLNGATYVAKMLVNEAAPYLVDPTSWVAGAGTGKLAHKGAVIALQKVSSPLVRKAGEGMVVGSATGLAESFVYTANNFREFSNDELMKTWALDAGMGGAFGGIIASAVHGVSSYGARAKGKALGDGVDDIQFDREAHERSVAENPEPDLETAEVPEPTEVPLTRVEQAAIEARQVMEATTKAQETTRARVDTMKVPDLKTELKEIYAELGIRGHSKFKKKADIQEEIIKRRGLQEEARVKEELNANRPQTERGDAEVFKAETDLIAKRMKELRDGVESDLVDGAEPLTADVDVDPAPTIPKPSPKPPVDSEGKPKQPASTADQVPTDTRTPDEIQAQEEQWQMDTMKAELEHQGHVVRPAMEEANKKHNLLAKIHRALGKGLGLQEFASKMMFSKDNKLAYIGTHILETGVGFSGRFKRKASAALIKDGIYTKNVGNLNKAYVDNIKGWAMQQGNGTYKAFKAAWEGGKVNDVAKQFHREVFKRQELRQQGKYVEPNQFLDAYTDTLNQVNDELFDGRIRSNIKGFDDNRRIKNYIPHIWKKVKVAEIVKRHGERAVKDLLRDSIESAKRNGKLASDVSVDELVNDQFNWINGLGDSLEHMDEVGAGVSGRGKSRVPLDFTVERNGISMLDLVDTDIPTMMDSYIQRAGADIGISDATNGLIRSEGDFEKFLTPESDADKLLVQDAKDLLYGRPTRQGMSPELRSMMDIVTIQQMGGIGVAQMAETGTMAQRLIVNYMSQPKIAKKIWAMAGESMDDKGVLHQVRSIAAVNDNMEYINRYSVNNIDQAQVDELSNLRAASIDAVDKGTLGAYKAQFGRMLGSLSGVNAVQKAQSRLLQASFSVDVARGFKFGKGTSTVDRLTDLGLTEDSYVARSIREFVEFDTDGFPTNFNFDQWSKEALNEFSYAMNREEAQLMPRVMAGELPVFMNKPLWQAIMQFRKTPLAFMSKGTQRNLQFADREAVLGTVLNSMTAGVTRAAKVAAAGAAYSVISDEEFFMGSDSLDAFHKMQPYNYVSNFGILGDGYSIGREFAKANEKSGLEALWEGAQVVPVLSAVDNAYHAVDGDPAAIKRAMPLNSLPMVTEVSNAVIRNMETN